MAQFPDLAGVDAKGKVYLKVRLYKYTTPSAARILGLDSGGTGNLKDFICQYKRNTEKFKAPVLSIRSSFFPTTTRVRRESAASQRRQIPARKGDI